MAYNEIIELISYIVVSQTAEKKIPTLIFLSEIKKEELIKYIISRLSGSETNIFGTPSVIPWEKVAQIMRELSEIPLLIKETSDIKELLKNAEDFIKEMNNKNGIIIINSADLQTEKITVPENISLFFIN